RHKCDTCCRSRKGRGRGGGAAPACARPLPGRIPGRTGNVCGNCRATASRRGYGMTDTKSGDENTLTVNTKKTLTLKRPGAEQSTVRQNFSHGRTKSVVVETKRKFVKPGERPDPGFAPRAQPAPSPVSQAPAPRPQAPPPPPVAPRPQQ